jgi:tRNA(Ile)-lysidine synthetase-like protein
MESVERAVQAVAAGTYVVAVSGGVDSMSLLYALCQRADLKLIVAHANHGIRDDGAEDAALVAQFCMSHNIIYEYKELHLGPHASEERARGARYDFLQKCRIKYRATSIITAHHQDDLIETALINMLRGTGWRGLAPFTNGQNIARPLLGMPKKVVAQYASVCGVPWRPDSTNANQHYLRNYVRQTIKPYLNKQNPKWQSELLQLIRKNQLLRRTIEAELDKYLTLQLLNSGEQWATQRYIWCMLPGPTDYELFQQLCRRILGNSVVRELAESALAFAKTGLPNKIMPLNNGWQLRVTRRELIVEPR